MAAGLGTAAGGAVLYHRPGCPYCAEARTTLDVEGVAFSEVQVSGGGDEADVPDGPRISRAELAALCDEDVQTLTVPKVFIGNLLIRSSEELRDLRATSALRDLARRAGAVSTSAPVRQHLDADDAAGAVCLLHTGPTTTVWLEELRSRLERLGAKVRFLDAERLGAFDPTVRIPYSVVVNRVSDAAVPPLARFIASFLSLSVCQGIPVVNGALAYAVATSKIAQHALFHAQGLQAPPSQVVRCAADVDAAALALGGGPLLFKPNAGSFGKGIVKFDDPGALHAHAERPAAFGNDGVALLQRFYPVSQTHRVFVLDGKVQCGVAVSFDEGQFTGQCMATAQKRRRTDGAAAVSVEEVRDEVRDGCLRVLRASKADVASLEYLVEPDTGKLLFYDLNLLSTYPDPQVVGRDCWMELAQYILGKRGT